MMEGSRRKRSRALSAGTAPDGDDAVPALKVDGASFEPGSFASRGSIKLIHEVVAKFDSYKKRIVRSCGFEGILYFPEVKQLNRRFSMWLMSGVNAETSTLNVGEHNSIKFAKSDVGHVLGIPTSGKKVGGIHRCVEEDKRRVLDEFLCPRFKEKRSIKLVQEIIEHEYTYPMLKSDYDKFRVAFVIFVVSNLLAPSNKHDYAGIDYWDAIADPDIIHTFDWSEYVIVKLLEAVSKLKQDLARNIKFPLVSGCSFFLQVLYLDSLDIEGLKTCQNTFPRARDFTYERMHAMILADKNFLRYTKGDREMPSEKLRHPLECVYLWASKQQSVRKEPQMAIWESAVAMVRLLNVPLEAAGPVFIAAADFQDRINSGLFVTGTQASTFMTVLLSIMTPYTRGFSYCMVHGMDEESDGLKNSNTNGITALAGPSRLKKKKQCDMGCVHCGKKAQTQCEIDSVYPSETPESSVPSSVPNSVTLRVQRMIIGDDVESSYNDALSGLDGMPHNFNLNSDVSTSMSQFYKSLRSLKPCRGFDLNVLDGSNSGESMSNLSSSVISYLPSPWEIGYAWEHTDINYNDINEKFECLDGYNRMVIVHMNPKYIQVSGADLRAQLMGRSEMKLDLFDGLIRSLRQQDDICYGSFGQMRWRHFFESDLMECIMSGSIFAAESSMRERLLMGNLQYDLTKCKIFFFPALLQWSWVCFAWCMDENVINVFEPSFYEPPEARIAVIERCFFRLKIIMRSIWEVVHSGMNIWEVSGMKRYRILSPKIRLLTLSDASIPRLNRSGALCYMFCRCFNGADLNPVDMVVDPDRLGAKLLFDILQMKQNSGSFPECFKQTL